MLSAVVHNVTDHLLQQVAELSILEMNILPVCCLERLCSETVNYWLLLHNFKRKASLLCKVCSVLVMPDMGKLVKAVGV